MTGAKALKVGVFYDGSYFTRVSNYYNYVHPHRRRIHIGGLHEFVQAQIAEKEGTSPTLCHVVDAHFFRGRFTAKEAHEKPNQLYYDRVFDDVLMYNGVQTHYLPVKDSMGRKREKGIDVLMALETFELAMLKRYDVVVLVCSDSDFVPLVRKLHGLGSKTMLLGWDFEFTEEETGELQTTKTSTDLWNTVSYPLPMHTLIEEGLGEEDPAVLDLFVERDTARLEDITMPTYDGPMPSADERSRSTVMSLHNGYGFIRYPENNLFFLHEDLQNVEFADLAIGDVVDFQVDVNTRGQRVAKRVHKVLEEA
jgi:uncharacterized LabA/DUF88 family protein/cold shock CspA family protein